nr:tetratricopeptide repeat protein [uncultured Holophaga sp.]
MSQSPDPYQEYLDRAERLFQSGDVVQAGQIWQAILKRVPEHATAKAGLYQVKRHFDSRATQDGLDRAQRTDPRSTSSVPAPRPSSTELTKLLERGCALYDVGQIAEALELWNEVLDRDPGNPLAQGYIQQARRMLPQEPPAPAPVAAVEPSAPEEAPTETLLKEGCTLYDMGELQGALAKWEKALAADPGHPLARQYAEGARRELGLPALAAAPIPAASAGGELPQDAPPPAPGREDEDPLGRMIIEGVQLFDMGMPEEAILRWERVLEQAPDQAEAQGYLAMARQAAEAPAPPSAQVVTAPPEADPLQGLFSDAEDLMRRQLFPEAADVYQRLLQRRPEDPRALQGYQQARALATATLAPPILPPPPEPVEPPPSVIPPAAIEQPSAAPRRGLSLHHLVRRLSLPPWALSPKALITAVVTFLVLLVASYVIHVFRQDRALAAEVASRQGRVLAPVRRNTQIPNLAEDPAAIRKEAESVVGEDSLLAYFRARELVRLRPSDASANQLMEKTRGGLASTVTGSCSLEEFEKMVSIGDLDAADKLMDGLLRLDPDNPLLRARAARVWLAKAQVHASKEHWDEARDMLRRGRAAFPQDSIWQARLRLLDQIQAMPKGDRPGWVQLLG